MENDIFDDDGNVCLSALASGKRYPKDDPRHLTPGLVDQLARHRIKQMEAEAAANIAMLKANGLL